MKLFSIKNYLVSIEGNQSEGWSVSESEKSSRVFFNFEIEELENNGGFLLLAFNNNEEIYADTWHQSVKDAMEVAKDEYGISKDLWKEIK